MTVQEWQAETILGAAEQLAHTIKSTAPERLDWKPVADDLSQATSALDMLDECIGVNRRFTALLRGESPQGGPADGGRLFRSAEQGVEMLLQSAREAAETVRNLDESVLTKTFKLRMGERSGAVLLRIMTGNMIYHNGQINYIQLLYGDTEMHR
jgi:hypothetical protein